MGGGNLIYMTIDKVKESLMVFLLLTTLFDSNPLFAVYDGTESIVCEYNVHYFSTDPNLETDRIKTLVSRLSRALEKGMRQINVDREIFVVLNPDIHSKPIKDEALKEHFLKTKPDFLIFEESPDEKVLNLLKENNLNPLVVILRDVQMKKSEEEFIDSSSKTMLEAILKGEGS